MRRLDELYPAEFRNWVENLKRLYLWRKAGYPMDADELSYAGWNALAHITRYYELQDLKAIQPIAPASGSK